MGLIEEIRDKAVSSKTPLEDVMRHCMVLARKLKHEPLQQWTHNELNGYKTLANIPEYRVVQAQLRERVRNPITGSDLVSTAVMPPNVERLLRTIPLDQGIAELESQHKSGGLRYAVSDGILDHIEKTEDGYHAFRLSSAFREVSSSQLQGVLSAIRNRTLEFVLSLEDESTDIEKAAPGTSPVSLNELDQRFGIYIMGDGNVVTVAGQSAIVHAIERQVVRNDLPSLKAFLLEQGVNEAAVETLDEVIEGAKPSDLNDERSALRRWVDDAAKSIAGGGKALLLTAAKEAILLATRYYFGEVAGTS